MLFKCVLLLLTIVVPGISQHQYSSLFIEIENHQITEGCANFNFSAKIQLRVNHMTKILDGCENHTISPNISMTRNDIALCTFNESNCYGISNNEVHNALDLDWIELRYVFCGNPILQNIYLWDYNDFNISTQGGNFFAFKRSDNIPISYCNHGYTSLENVLFCKKETDDPDCGFKMSTSAPSTTTPSISTTNTPHFMTSTDASLISTENTVSEIFTTTTESTLTTTTTPSNIPTTFFTINTPLHNPSTSTEVSSPYTFSTIFSPTIRSTTLSDTTLSPTVNTISAIKTTTFASTLITSATSDFSTSSTEIIRTTTTEADSTIQSKSTILIEESTTTTSSNGPTTNTYSHHSFPTTKLSSSDSASTFTSVNLTTITPTTILTTLSDTSITSTDYTVSSLTSSTDPNTVSNISTYSTDSTHSTIFPSKTTSVSSTISSKSSTKSTIKSTTTTTIIPTVLTISTKNTQQSNPFSTISPLLSTTLQTTTSFALTSPSTEFTTNNFSQETSSTTTPQQSTPFVPPQNPYDINCTNPDSDLDAIYCHVEATNYTATEISGIINNTLASINVTKLTPKEVFAVVGIFRRCSEIPDLTYRAFTDMSRLVDTMLEAPSESYIHTHEAGIKTTKLILDSVNRVILNSPSDVSYLNGNNVALLGKQLNCGTGDAGGLIDTGSEFSGDTSTKARASISIDGNVACQGQGQRVFYTIYRNSKFFIGSNTKETAKNHFFINFDDEITTTETSEKNSKKCDPSLFGTDDSILSGNVISTNSSSSASKFIHSVEKEGKNQNIVKIKFDKKHIGVYLHGKLGIRWWDIAGNQWSSEACKVEENGDYYISTCSHLTDFTLLVDGVNVDPILCNKVLEIVNYIVSIGSMFSLLILNVIYIIILIPPLSQKIFSNLFLKIVPKSDKNIASFIYSLLLFLFFFIFTLFTNQDQVVIKTGCYIVAALNYWLLMTCIMLSLFQSWKIVKMFVWNSKLERIFHLITMKKVIYPIAFTFSTLMTILYGVFTQGDFFQRNDSFCWIRPDYLIGAVIIPLTILSINAILTIFIMSLRLFPHFKISKLIRTSSTKINKISNKEARERAFVLFLVQFTLGVPWLLQYFTLFEPKATAWHFLFVIVNGSQGIIILISFIYRCYGTYKSYHLQKRLWT